MCDVGQGKTVLGHVVLKQTWKIGCLTHYLWSGFSYCPVSTPWLHMCEHMSLPPHTPTHLCSTHVWLYCWFVVPADKVERGHRNGERVSVRPCVRPSVRGFRPLSGKAISQFISNLIYAFARWAWWMLMAWILLTGFRPVLAGLAVTVHKGAYEQEVSIPRP